MPVDAFFDVVTIATGKAINQTVVPVRANSKTDADIFVISVISESERRLRGYQAADNYSHARIDIDLPEGVIFVDVGFWLDREVMLLFTATEGYVYDPWTKTTQTLVRFSSIYGTAVFDEVPRINVFRDINGDGLDDFVIPTFSGYLISTQLDNGEFTLPLMLKAPPLMDMSYNSHPWYQAKQLYLADMTLDGRKDITFWVETEFNIYPQLENGQFSPDVIKVGSDVAFDFDGIDGISIRMTDEDQSNQLITVLYDLKDMDGDGVTDLVTQSIKSKGVLNKSTTLRYYRGRASRTETNKVVRFDKNVMSTIESNGFQYEMIMRDLNVDGQIDIVVSSVEIGVARIIRALLTSSLRIDLSFYPMKQGLYAAKPESVKEITARFSLASGEVWLPAVLISDVDGDNIDDLLVQEGDDTLLVYRGQRGEKLFATDVVEIKTQMPRDPRMVSLATINDDDIRDIVLKIPPPISNRQGPHYVALLISNSRRNLLSDNEEAPH